MGYQGNHCTLPVLVSNAFDLKKKKSKVRKKWWWQNAWLAATTLFILSWAFYGATIGNDYNLDDELVTNGHVLTSQGVSAIPTIFQSYYYEDGAGNAFDYRPITLSSFALEHELFGASPAIGHAINVVIYAFSVVLIFWLVYRYLLPRRFWLVVGISILFLVHPIHSEVVNSIKCRDELLAMFFGLGALGCFLHGTDKRHYLWWYLGGASLFSLGLLSKLSALPLAVLIPTGILLFRSATIKQIVVASIFLAGISLALLPPLSFDRYVLFGGVILIAPLVLSEIRGAYASTRTGMLDLWRSESFRLRVSLAGLLPLLFLSLVCLGFVPYSYGLILVSWLTISVLVLWWLENAHAWVILMSQAVLLGVVAYLGFGQHIVHLGLMIPLALLLRRDVDLKPWYLLSIAIPFVCYWMLGQVESLLTFLPAILVGVALMVNRLEIKRWLRLALTVPLLAVIGFTANHGVIGLSLVITAAAICLWWTYLRPADSHKRSIVFLSAVLLGIVIQLSLSKAAPHQEASIPVLETSELDEAGTRLLTYTENPIFYLGDQSDKSASAMSVMVEYGRLLLWPSRLQSYYGFDTVPIVNWLHWRVFVGLLILLGLISIFFYYLLRNAALSWGALLLLVSLLQFSNLIVPAPGMVAERFLYVGSLGFVLVVGIGLQGVLHRLVATRIQRRSFLLLVLILAGLSWWQVNQRNQDWQDAETLYRQDVAAAPSSAKLQQLLAAALMEKVVSAPAAAQASLLAEAESHQLACLAIYDKIPYGYYDLGMIYLQQNRLEEAEASFRQAAETDLQPAMALYQMAGLQERQTRFAEAEQNYQAALSADSTLLSAYINLSTMYFTQERFAVGLELSETALNQWPNQIDLLNNTGNALATTGRFMEAAALFERALVILPGDQQLLQKIIYCYEQSGRTDLAQPFILQMR